MKNILFTITLSGISLLTACQSGITGEGSADIAQDYATGTFNEVEAKGLFKLILVENDSAYVSVQTHKNLIDNLNITTTGNQLSIEENKPVDGFETYEVYVYYKDPIKDVEIGEKVLLEAAGTVVSNNFELSAEDNAKVANFNLKSKDIKIETEDQAEIEITGETIELKYKAKDKSRIDGEDLSAELLKVDLTNEAVVNANVSKELKGRVLDNAILNYKGNPSKNIDVKERGEINNL